MLHPSHSQYEPQNMYCRGKGVWVGGVTHFENSEVSMVALIKISRKSRRFRITSLNKPNRKSTDTWRSCTCTRQDALTHTTHNTHGTQPHKYPSQRGVVAGHVAALRNGAERKAAHGSKHVPRRQSRQSTGSTVDRLQTAATERLR